MYEQRSRGKARVLRRLVPAPEVRHHPSTAAEYALGRVRKPVAIACNGCRKHKTKCSGERPACRRCVQQRLPCRYVAQPGETSSQALHRNYNDLQSRASVLEEVFGLLKNLPDQDAQDLLDRIRSGADARTILNHIEAGDVLLQMAVRPETRFRYEFPYRSEMPVEYTSENPYLDSLIFEAASLHSKDQGPPTASEDRFLANLDSQEYHGIYLKPFHAAQVVEPLLYDARISQWTNVCEEDALMRDLLTVFFRCEYQFTAAFQKNYFLEDLAAPRKDFCSSLLVNIVLAYACVCYPHFPNRSEYWNPLTLTYRFFVEAKRLWELEATEPRITTIQSGILFSVFYNLCGLDEIGQAYRIQSVALARQLRLFDSTTDERSERKRNGRAFTAWALYNWESLVAFSFVHAPLVTKPPSWPLPDPLEDSSWYGEVWVKYPLSHSLSPSYFGHVLEARSRFRIIMNGFCKMAYSQESGVTLEKAEELLSQLRGWFNSLSGPLLPKRIVLPCHLQLHIYYHHLILTIFEPLLNIKASQESTTGQVVAESKKYLQTLVRLYYLRHGFEAMDLFIVIPLMLAGVDCIEAISDQTPSSRLEELRSTIILVAKGLSSQRKNHYLAEALYRVIRGRMRAQEVALLKDTLNPEEEADEKRAMVQAVRSHWPVSVVKKKEDMDTHILTNLVESYAHLNIGETVNEKRPL